MARYIDIDKVKPDCISTKGGVAISQSQLASQPTADVIERSKYESLQNQLHHWEHEHAKRILENSDLRSKIDKAIKEVENAPTFDYKLHLTKTEVIRKDVVLEILKKAIEEIPDNAPYDPLDCIPSDYDLFEDMELSNPNHTTSLC